ncbi:hypothetical protein CRM22_006936 [Opisthorchis felineus]|uniref:Uncharacterized protein n=3 Tax=Opisthorchis felineus TaxID=147828 RepID=A0A4S2LR22_OPIFE|nr:hypothetical protein CRM22_006936 [Opisthorchis felineus]
MLDSQSEIVEVCEVTQQDSEVDPSAEPVSKGSNLLEMFGLEDQLFNRTVSESGPSDVSVLEFKNGNHYEGNLVNGRLHGLGKFTWEASGITYTGQFVNSQISGNGRMEWPDGSYYEGGFLQGKRHGTGTYYHPLGITYRGEWLDGKKHGKGRLEYTSDGSCYYDGDWFEDISQGYGFSKYPDGTTYEGEWFGGNRCGYGTMHWKDRDEIYSGCWVAGKQEGQGSHAWHILRVRTTQYTLPNVYDGEWKNGVRHGFGVFHYPNGSKYAGYWKDNMKHGKGNLILKDGRVFERMFKEDCLIGRLDDPAVDDTGQLGLERLDTRLPLFPEITSGVPPVESMSSNTSDSNLLEYYIRPHLASEHNTTQELKAMQNCITTHVAALRCIYQFYGRLGLNEMPDNTIILKHFQLCQLIKDCRLHQHTSLAEIDRIIGKIYPFTTEEADHVRWPDSLISFCAFVNILAILACNLCSQVQLFQHRGRIERGKPSDGLAFLLTQVVLRSACKISGPLYENKQKTREIFAFREPTFHIFQFLSRFYSKPTNPGSTITMRQFLFMLRDYELLDAKLTTKDVVELLCANNPAAGPPTECNLDVELTFFDFFEALVQCATHTRAEEPPTEQPPEGVEEVEPIEALPKEEGTSSAQKETTGLTTRQSTKYAPSSTSTTGRKSRERKRKVREVRKSSLQPDVLKEADQPTPPVMVEETVDELVKAPTEDRNVTPTVPEAEELDEFTVWKMRLENFFRQRFLPTAEKIENIRRIILESQTRTKAGYISAEHLKPL